MLSHLSFSVHYNSQHYFNQNKLFCLNVLKIPLYRNLFNHSAITQDLCNFFMFIIFNNFSMFLILSYNVLPTYLQKSSFNFLLILLYRKVVLNWERFSHLAFDTVQRHVWLSQLGGVGGPATSILLVVVRDAAKHSIVHRTAPSQQRIIQLKSCQS